MPDVKNDNKAQEKQRDLPQVNICCFDRCADLRGVMLGQRFI